MTTQAPSPARRRATNPQNLLDEFALVAPGQVSAPTLVTVLFDAPDVNPHSLGPNVVSRTSAANTNEINPVTISLAAATLGMLLIALVGVGGFTVLAQRRLRSIGMLGAQGATDASVGLVVSANGFATGVVGAVCGFALGLAAWLAYRPRAEASAHHVMGAFQLPWLVIFVSMALAVLAAYLAAVRPARALARVPIVAALAGRPLTQVSHRACGALAWLLAGERLPGGAEDREVAVAVVDSCLGSAPGGASSGALVCRPLPIARGCQREQDPPHQEPQIPDPSVPAQSGPVHAPPGVRRDLPAWPWSAHMLLTCRNAAQRCAMTGGVERCCKAKMRPVGSGNRRSAGRELTAAVDHDSAQTRPRSPSSCTTPAR